MVFIKGVSGNPEGRKNGKPLTDALIGRLLWDADAKVRAGDKRTVAHAIVDKLINNALQGDSRSIEQIFDRVEGKATQHIEQKTTHELLDVVEAARRIAFAFNSAAIQGVEIEGVFKELVEPEPSAPFVPVVLPPVNLKPPKGKSYSSPLIQRKPKP